MSRFDNIFSGNRPLPSMDTMFKMNDVSPAVQTHLVQVYGALTATLLAASVGAWAHLQLHLGGMLTGIACFGMMVRRFFASLAPCFVPCSHLGRFPLQHPLRRRIHLH